MEKWKWKKIHNKNKRLHDFHSTGNEWKWNGVEMYNQLIYLQKYISISTPLLEMSGNGNGVEMGHVPIKFFYTSSISGPEPI